MAPFAVGFGAHPDWQQALAAAVAGVDGRRAAGASPPTLGIVYVSGACVPHAAALLAALRDRWAGVAWVGSAGAGVIADGSEAFDGAAVALMLTDVPAARFEVFSGAKRLARVDPHTALVHADPATPELAELVAELADRTASGCVFGGLAASPAGSVHIADGVWRGGLSGVAFDADVTLVSRVTQGSQPVGPVRRITAAERNVVVALDGEPALPCLLRDLGIGGAGADARAALPRVAETLVGISDAGDAALARASQFGGDVRVRHLIGLDPGRGAVAVAEMVEAGQQLAFCRRDADAARRDLVRICSEVRDELDGRAARGAIYVSCAGRGGPHFGAAHAEAQIVRRALGADVPTVGFFAGGEIARHHVYGYTGVLTVFAAAA